MHVKKTKTLLVRKQNQYCGQLLATTCKNKKDLFAIRLNLCSKKSGPQEYHSHFRIDCGTFVSHCLHFKNVNFLFCTTI